MRHGAFSFVNKNAIKHEKNAPFLCIGHFFRCPYVVKNPFGAFFQERWGIFSFRGVGNPAFDFHPCITGTTKKAFGLSHMASSHVLSSSSSSSLSRRQALRTLSRRREKDSEEVNLRWDFYLESFFNLHRCGCCAAASQFLFSWNIAAALGLCKVVVDVVLVATPVVVVVAVAVVAVVAAIVVIAAVPLVASVAAVEVEVAFGGAAAVFPSHVCFFHLSSPLLRVHPQHCLRGNSHQRGGNHRIMMVLLPLQQPQHQHQGRRRQRPGRCCRRQSGQSGDDGHETQEELHIHRYSLLALAKNICWHGLYAKQVCVTLTTPTLNLRM